MSSDGASTRYNFLCDEDVLEDAKRNSEHGELAELGRQMLHRVAYGTVDEGHSELARLKAQLRDTRNRTDSKRRQRREIDAEIETLESRATRLEERIESLEAERDELAVTLETLENMLQGGERMWPTRIRTAADVEESTAQDLWHRLQERNDDLPTVAFEEPSIHTPADWREALEEAEP